MGVTLAIAWSPKSAIKEDISRQVKNLPSVQSAIAYTQERKKVRVFLASPYHFPLFQTFNR